MIGKSIDILIIAETKIDSSFPNTRFIIEKFLRSVKLDRNTFGGGVLIHAQEDIPSKHKRPDDMEERFIEINLRKVKWQLTKYKKPINFCSKKGRKKIYSNSDIKNVYLFTYLFIYLFIIYLYQYLYRLKYALINVQYQTP